MRWEGKQSCGCGIRCLGDPLQIHDGHRSLCVAGLHGAVLCKPVDSDLRPKFRTCAPHAGSASSSFFGNMLRFHGDTKSADNQDGSSREWRTSCVDVLSVSVFFKTGIYVVSTPQQSADTGSWMWWTRQDTSGHDPVTLCSLETHAMNVSKTRPHFHPVFFLFRSKLPVLWIKHERNTTWSWNIDRVSGCDDDILSFLAKYSLSTLYTLLQMPFLFLNSFSWILFYPHAESSMLRDTRQQTNLIPVLMPVVSPHREMGVNWISIVSDRHVIVLGLVVSSSTPNRGGTIWITGVL